MRWLALVAVVGTFGISAYHRHRARRSGGEVLRRRSEGPRIMLSRAIVALPLFLSVLIREEDALIARFGDAYREYMGRTGKLLPSYIRSVHRDVSASR